MGESLLLNSLSSILPSPDTGEDVEFVHLEDKYICPIPKDARSVPHVLRNARQLPCGHHICERRIDELFGDQPSASCPIKDEDCLEPFSKKEFISGEEIDRYFMGRDRRGNSVTAIDKISMTSTEAIHTILIFLILLHNSAITSAQEEKQMSNGMPTHAVDIKGGAIFIEENKGASINVTNTTGHSDQNKDSDKYTYIVIAVVIIAIVVIGIVTLVCVSKKCHKLSLCCGQNDGDIQLRNNAQKMDLMNSTIRTETHVDE